MPPISRPRVGLLGPRRARQGLGPYFARWLQQAGAEVPAFAVSRPASFEAAKETLRTALRTEPRGYVGVHAMLAAEDLDALVIASPIDTHEPALVAALDAGVHVLCEKPVLRPGPAAAERISVLARSFHERGLWLWVNVQWPYVLPAYFELFPEQRGAPIEQFWMLLSPSSVGVEAVLDSAPHPLSVLQALAGEPGGELHDAAVVQSDGAGRALDLSFRFRHTRGEIGAHVVLRHCAQPPRPAGLGINGQIALRRIELPSYRLHLDGPAASLPVADPLGALVGDFVRALQTGRRPELAVSAIARARMLASLIAVSPRPSGGEER